MQGLEFVDVPGLVILATGAGVMGIMLLTGIGWRRHDREAIERLHTAAQCAGELLEIDYEEVTTPVIYTSADMARCREGLAVRPLRRRAV